MCTLMGEPCRDHVHPDGGTMQVSYIDSDGVCVCVINGECMCTCVCVGACV